MAPKMVRGIEGRAPISSLRGDHFRIFFATLSFMLILLRSARPPTHLHAPRFIRSAAYSRRNFLAAQFLFFLANRGGPRGGPRAPCKRPRAKGPKGPKGPRDQRALRALWAKGPFGAQAVRLYATNAIPNGIDNAQRKLIRMESIQGK